MGAAQRRFFCWYPGARPAQADNAHCPPGAQRLTCTVSGTTVREVDMKIPVLIVLALVLLGTGGTLAFMNNACKSSQHSWCASDLRHHAKAGRS